MYIGPTISKYHLIENSVYLNTYPNNVQQAIKEYPIAAKLFIDIEKFIKEIVKEIEYITVY
ncbi:hypothetical protein HMPREF9466_00691 [Fusobacterium necrophorum subsp. funduliforme 1_1_36S]|nr:hypothetical protein HMPREF9466_00691 [Fusobacterium necrophorum subsp. funduliforme 1_1_36S]